MRYLIIDRDNLRLLGVTDSVQKASLIGWNDHPDVAILIFSIEMKSNWSQLDRMELTMLYKNELGSGENIHDYGRMLNELHEAAEKLPLDQRSIFALSEAAKGLPEDFGAGPTGFKPQVHRASAEQAGAARVVDPKPKTERAPREPGSAPSPKGATGKVWAIADRVHAENGGGLIDKVMRTKIIDACVAEGINAATAGTQYSKWKATK